MDWGVIINSIIFVIVVGLFLVIKLSNILPKVTVNAYFAFTFISALTVVGTVIKKYLDNEQFSLVYVGVFVLNAILGMVIMHSINIKLFYAFFSIFVVCILGFLYILVDSDTTPNPPANPQATTWFNLTGWDDFKTKSLEMFDFLFSWDKTTPLSTIITGIGYFIKAIPTFIIWIFYALFSGMSAFFGLFSTAQTTPASKAFAQETYLGESVRKTLFYSLTLLLFMLGLIIIVVSQEAMRKQPLNVLAVAFVAAFSYLGYVRFFHSELFLKQFMMTLFGLFMIGIYLYNPANILQNITGTNFTIIFFIFIYLIGMIFIYNFFTDPTDTIKGYKNIQDKSAIMADKFKDSFGKVAYIMIGLSICISMIIFMVGAIEKAQGGQSTIGMYILNTLIVVGMLTIIYNSFDTNKLLPDNLYFKLFWNMILYIPCLLSDLADMIMSEYYKTKYFTLIIVVLEIIFIMAYWFIYPDAISKIYSDEGQVIINTPTSLASLKTVGYYRNLSGSTLLDPNSNKKMSKKEIASNNSDVYLNPVSGKPLLDPSGNPIKDDVGNYFMPTRVNTYHYCMSFWLYINPMPSYGDKLVSLLNYGNNPNVMYNPSKNDFSVFMKSPDPDCSTNVTIPIYTNMDIPLQKWFNIVLNYDSGRLDVFLNAELVKTSFDVISCIDYDALTIGEDSGANAKICNLTYFQAPVDIVTIRRMYNVAKIQDTPIVPKKDLFSI